MRDSEIKHLHRGCLKARQDADGRTYRWNVTSLAFKGESSPAGNPATWVVGEPAARAVAVLEQLQPPEQTLLFAHLPYSSAVGPARAAANTAITTKATNQQLLELLVLKLDVVLSLESGLDVLDDLPPLRAVRPLVLKKMIFDLWEPVL